MGELGWHMAAVAGAQTGRVRPKGERHVIQRLSFRLSHLANGGVALAGLLIFAAFVGIVLPPQDEKMAGYAGAAAVPDLSFHYSAAELHDMAEAYGPEGRQFYVKTRFTFDALWPLIYAVFLVAALGWTGRLLHDGTASRLRLANIAPITAAVCDYGENLSVAWVVSGYPAKSPLAGVATAFTMAKWVFLVGSFVALAAMIAVLIWERLKRPGPPVAMEKEEAE